MNNGEKTKDAPTKEVFEDATTLVNSSLEIPEITKIIKLLNEGGMNLPENIFTIDEAVEEICKALGVEK